MSKYYRTIFAVVAALHLGACANANISQQDSHPPRHIISVNDGQRRINTIECKDFDDWYLDGYRVGKSYGGYKEKLLNYRVNYCQTNLAKADLQRFKANWENGYMVGAKDMARPVHKGKTKKRKRLLS